jgi:O-antigen ligase
LVRLANLAYLPAAAFAMVLTGTRGAVVASIPSAVFVLWSIWRQPRRARLVQVGAVGAAVILVATLAPPELLSRIGSAATEFSGAGDRAEVIWSRSLDVFWDHPVVGVGFNAHRAAVPLGFHITRGVAHSSLAKEAHNTPISILVETGIIGFAIFVALAVTLLRAVSVLPRPQVRYWVTQLAVISVGAQTLSLEESKAVWFFFGIAIAATAAGYSRAAENGREPARSWAPAQL